MLGSSSTTSNRASGFAPSARPAESRPDGCSIGWLTSTPSSPPAAPVLVAAVQRDLGHLPRSVAGVGHRDRVTGLVRAHGADQRVSIRDLGAVDLDHDVTGP